MTEKSPATTETAEAFQALAAMMYAADDYEQTYAAICQAATRLVDGCDHASLMLMRHGKPYTAAASDEIADRIDQFERDVGDGP